MRLFLCVLFTTAILSVSASPALAYIGPGLGAGTLAVIFGFIISIFLAVFAVIWYPLKRIFLKLGLKKKHNETLEREDKNN
jgi:hypothetical protein